jgi:hypothetical protein
LPRQALHNKGQPHNEEQSRAADLPGNIGGNDKDSRPNHRARDNHARIEKAKTLDQTGMQGDGRSLRRLNFFRHDQRSSTSRRQTEFQAQTFG